VSEQSIHVDLQQKRGLGLGGKVLALPRPRPRPEVPRPRPRLHEVSSRPRPGLEDNKTGTEIEKLENFGSLNFLSMF